MSAGNSMTGKTAASTFTLVHLLPSSEVQMPVDFVTPSMPTATKPSCHAVMPLRFDASGSPAVSRVHVNELGSTGGPVVLGAAVVVVDVERDDDLVVELCCFAALSSLHAAAAATTATIAT